VKGGNRVNVSFIIRIDISSFGVGVKSDILLTVEMNKEKIGRDLSFRMLRLSSLNLDQGLSALPTWTSVSWWASSNARMITGA